LQNLLGRGRQRRQASRMNWKPHFRRAKLTFQPIELGDRVRDPITGYQGICTCVTTWLHGCIRVGVQAEALHDGKPVEDRHFDQSQLIVVDKRVHEPMVLGVVAKPAPEERRSSGGPSRETPGFKK
jgi:hypothetical protein